jgi:hypothetical protein
MTLRPPIDAIFDLFKEAAPAAVTVPPAAPVSADVVWLPSRAAQEAIGTGTVLDTMPRLSVRRDQVPELTIGSRIEVAPMGGNTVRTWTVRRIDAVDAERIVAAVM